MQTAKNKHLDRFVVYDNEGGVIMEHQIDGLILLANPTADEQIRIELLSKKKTNGVPVISYQGGKPMNVMTLLNLFRSVVNDLMTKWSAYLEKEEEPKTKIIV